MTRAEIDAFLIHHLQSFAGRSAATIAADHAEDGVREEREPPQHDPRPEHPARDRQRDDLDERALHEREREGLGEGVHDPRA